MASVNKVILVGNLGQDPEVKVVGDTKVANVSLATSEAYKDKQGNRVENTEWHSLEFWGAQAEIAEKYLNKGSSIYVEGKMKTEKWEKEGHKFSRTKIRVTSLTMLGGKPDGQNASAAPQHSSSSPGAMQGQPNDSYHGQDTFTPDGDEDKLPF